MRALEDQMHSTKEEKPYSKEPCRKCGQFMVTVDDVDVSDGIDYVIHCDACGDHYRVDGPDA
jgi:DNA-directed RNA polymerase subunit M/transcription elongation factor TFIIS